MEKKKKKGLNSSENRNVSIREFPCREGRHISCDSFPQDNNIVCPDSGRPGGGYRGFAALRQISTVFFVFVVFLTCAVHDVEGNL